MNWIESLVHASLRMPSALKKLPLEARYLPNFVCSAVEQFFSENEPQGPKKGVFLIFPGFFMLSFTLATLRKSVVQYHQAEAKRVVGSRWGIWGIDFLMKKAEAEFLLARERAKREGVPLVLVGYSFGGEAALRLNESYEGDAAKCILVCPPVNRAPLLLAFPFLLLFPTAREILRQDLLLFNPDCLCADNVRIIFGTKDGIAPAKEGSFPASANVLSLPLCHSGLLYSQDLVRHF